MISCKTNSNDDDFKKYNIPFFIYKYKYFDRNNLEKDDKQDTTFSSTNLKAEWN